ncbi:MAG TPA: choice-of-anchor Q domain-containing protein, partial [Candidatus Angelobacter sp.]|nr:choice-of-anchor Q domain-containing protein [Candidatus Angelobacter sp.]
AFGVGGGPATLMMRLRNNIVYQLTGEIYIDGVKAQIIGDKNLWFGTGAAPAQTTNNISVDPLFANRAIGDYHIAATSPAKDVGLTIVPNNSYEPNPGPTIDTDKDGVLRAQGAGFDLGAYEFFAGTASRPSPPANVRATVH